ncbi:hypothetical protein [Pseudovibrio brasiliensis]|uniref:Beta/Gamma crystallin n=1 Tax=Pseudovibrio brasiliensis TaxID=1898042 RepID=A0ABX8AIZ9_9HYPH|nr:hypothetical protein [Pseudovibrio brasiliensis]QUS55055.1 hypothetical protein KGB56_17060 [Pseudovibrio brasiliensis]
MLERTVASAAMNCSNRTGTRTAWISHMSYWACNNTCHQMIINTTSRHTVYVRVDLSNGTWRNRYVTSSNPLDFKWWEDLSAVHIKCTIQ